MLGLRSFSAIATIFIGGLLSAHGDTTPQSSPTASVENVTTYVDSNKGLIGIPYKVHNDSDDAIHVVSSLDNNNTGQAQGYPRDFTDTTTTDRKVDVPQLSAYSGAEGSVDYRANPTLGPNKVHSGSESHGVQSNPLWFVTSPVLPLLVASSEAIPGTRCRNQSRRFLKELSNYTLWAVEMFDSSVKVPMGIVAGNMYQLGNFDECIAVSVDRGTPHWLQGQYCIATVTFHASKSAPYTVDPYTIDYPPNVSVWEKLQDKGDPTKVRRDTMHWAMCVPASCSAQDLEQTLAHELRVIAETNGLDIKVRVRPQECQVDGQKADISAGTIVYSAILAILLILLVSSTWYDFMYETEKGGDASGTGRLVSTVEGIFMCFSARRNMRTLLSVPSDTQPAMLATHSIRFIFMLLIVGGHRVLLYAGHPAVHTDFEEKIFRDLAAALLGNGSVLVDAYFYMGGVILAYYLIKHLEETGKNVIIVITIVRYIRLTPVYMMVVFFYVTLLPHIGSGPFWETWVGLERDRCSSNWWTNALYINNYVNIENMCLVQSWYLAVDFQMYIISSLVLYMIWRWPKVGYSFLAILTVASIAVPFYITYVRKGPATLIPNPTNMHDLRQDYEFFDLYVMTHTRASPYLFGVITGLILYKFRDSTFRLSKVTSHLLFLFGVWVLGVVIMLSAHGFFLPWHEYNVLESSTYAAFHRVGMSAATFIFFFVLTFGNIDIWHKILSWKRFAPFGRLAYGAYLVHMLPQLYDQGSLRVPRIAMIYRVLWMALGDFIFAFTISLLMLLLIESPVRKMEKLLYSNKTIEKK